MLLTERMNGLIIFSKLLLIVSHLTSVSLLGHGEFKSPGGCNNTSSCDYTASWYVNPTGDVVTFTIVAKQASNTWTAIGFAPQRAMKDADVAYGFINSAGQALIYNGWIGTQYSTPTRDAIQNFFNTSLTYLNGVFTMTFSRNRISTDSFDYNFTNSDCYYFLFPVGGGPVTSDSIQHHFNTPKISQNKICISTLSVSSSSPSSESPTTGSSTSSSSALNGSSTTSSTTSASMLNSSTTTGSTTPSAFNGSSTTSSTTSSSTFNGSATTGSTTSSTSITSSSASSQSTVTSFSVTSGSSTSILTAMGPITTITVTVIVLAVILGDAVQTIIGGLVALIYLNSMSQQKNLKQRSSAVRFGTSIKQAISYDSKNAAFQDLRKSVPINT